jgi:hypothetical protein
LNRVNTPGAGSYNIKELDLLKRKDFGRSFTSAFQKPIAIKTKDKESLMPAPNQYNVIDKLKYKTNNVCADSAFKSKTKRKLSQEIAKDVPAPNFYDVKLDKSTRIPLSSFKSTSKRSLFSAVHFDKPGPSDYNPNEPFQEPINRQLFP